MVAAWLGVLSWVSLGLAFVSVGIILVDLLRFPQKMPIMNWVWPITALYAGPLGLWAYYRLGRSSAQNRREGAEPAQKPFWAQVAMGVMHCGSGCTLGDIIAEFTIFFAGLSAAGSVLGAEFISDYLLAYGLGVVFRFVSIAPMRGLAFWPGIWAAIKADTLSQTAFETGLFAWMALMYLVLFHPHLKPDHPTYWLMMQIGMLIGFATAYPMNWWLIRRGIKEAM
jgi:hypothetical protein